MKHFYKLFFTAIVSFAGFNFYSQAPSLSITAVMDLTTPAGGNTGKAIQFTANQNISDLSSYGFGTANNGGGTDGQEFTFPAVSVNQGQHIIVCRDSTVLSAYFDGCLEQFSGSQYPNLIYQDATEPSGNGDDAYELFHNSNVIETFGDVNTDGTGQPWEYLDSWAWKDPNASSTIANQTPGLFVVGPNVTWTNVFVACVTGDGNNGAQQTVTINVTALPPAGANWRPVKTTANGNWYTGAPATALSLGLNTLTVGSVAFDRSVKIQFSNDAIVFDDLTLNGNSVYAGNWTHGALNCSDGSNTTQTSNCPFPLALISCQAPPPPADLCYYVVDMQDSWGDGWNGASIDVSVNGTIVDTWSCAASSESDSLSTLNGDAVEFFFNSGSYDGEITFQIFDPSGVALGAFGPSPSTGSFLTHTSNSTCVPATVNVTFQVDMNQVSAGFAIPEVNGQWNSFCGNCNPLTDSNADGIWETTLPLLSGTYEYKFSADAWSIQEDLDTLLTCINYTSDPSAPNGYGYVNRVLNVGTSDLTLPLVCWNSCDPCFYSPQPPTGVTCTSGTPGQALSEDFENPSAIAFTGDLGTGSAGAWYLGTGGTASGLTGPSGAASGANYMFFEGSTGGLDTATLVTPMIDLSAGADAAELTFWMHAYGAAMGDLTIGWSSSDTGTFTPLYTHSGELQSSTDPWAMIGVDLTSYLGTSGYIGFTYCCRTGYTSDIAIDLVEVNSCFSCLAPSGLMSSNVTTNSADISWTPGGAETEWLLVVNGTGTVESASAASLTGLMANTAYVCEVYAICGAGDTSVVSSSYAFNTLCDVAVAPNNENFDAGLSNCWTQDTADVFDWSPRSGSTPSGGTGPTDDFTGGGGYMYTEASLPRAHGDSAIMHSEEIDISGLTNPELRFLSHMYGDAQGTLRVDMWDGSAYTNVFTKSGDQGNQWNEELALLATAATIISFKVTAVLDTNAGGQAWTGDMAIDEFGVREAQANDLAIIAAVAQSGCDLTSAEPIEVWVENQGLSVESNFDVSYSVNGGTPVVETFTGQLPPGDTLMHVFAATADMSADGIYNVDLHVDLATDNDTTDNHYLTSGENYLTPAAATTMGDTICDGDTAYVSAMSDGYVVWYDAMTGGNVLGEDEDLMVAPNTTTSYYAEVMAVDGFYEDFESYTAGDLIAASSNVWEAWTGPNGGGADDAEVSSAQANDGSNSLLLDNANGDDVVLPFGEAYNSGLFIYSMDMYIETSAYFNLQASTSIGAAWAFDVILNGNVFDIQIGGASVLTGSYSGTDPMNNPKWFNITFEANITDSIWEVFTSGISRGTFTYVGPVAAANLYANTGNKYYVDNVEWAALKDDACISGSRTEAIVEVNNCTGINSIGNSDFAIFPNPNKGEFTVSNSSDIINVNITDVQGKVVYSMSNINLNKINVNISDLEKGMYMINVETENTTITESVIVQ